MSQTMVHFLMCHFIFHLFPLIFLINCNSVVTSECHIIMMKISNKKQHEMRSFRWAGSQEHPVEISLCFLSQQWVPVIFRGGCLPSTQPKLWPALIWEGRRSMQDWEDITLFNSWQGTAIGDPKNINAKSICTGQARYNQQFVFNNVCLNTPQTAKTPTKSLE